MKKTILAVVVASTMGLSACTSDQAIFGGALAGGVIGGVTTNTVAGAAIGAGIGALAGAVLVKHLNGGWCHYRYKGKLFADHCR